MIRSASARYCASVSGGAPTTGTSGAGAARAAAAASEGPTVSAPARQESRRVHASTTAPKHAGRSRSHDVHGRARRGRHAAPVRWTPILLVLVLGCACCGGSAEPPRSRRRDADRRAGARARAGDRGRAGADRRRARSARRRLGYVDPERLANAGLPVRARRDERPRYGDGRSGDPRRQRGHRRSPTVRRRRPARSRPRRRAPSSPASATRSRRRSSAWATTRRSASGWRTAATASSCGSAARRTTSATST